MSRNKLGLAQLASQSDSSEDDKDVFYVEEFSEASDFSASESSLEVIIEYSKDGEQLINFPEENNSTAFIIPTMADHEIFIMNAPDINLSFDVNEQIMADSFDQYQIQKEDLPELDFDLCDD